MTVDRLKEIWYKNQGIYIALLINTSAFILDIFTPLGYVEWVLYQLPLLLVFSIPKEKIILLPISGSVLMFLGFFLSPMGIDPPVAVFNRTIGIFVLWVVWIFAKNRKQIDDLLKKEHDLLMAVVDSIPVMIIIYDPSVKQIHFNTYLEKLTGWTQADANNLMEKLYPDFEYRVQVMELMRSPETGWSDVRMTTRDGMEIDASWANVILEDGRQVSIGVDIRERKQAEEVLRRDNEMLERLVRDRTNDMLQQQQELDLNRRLSDIGTLAATVAHELRNPLAAINIAVSNVRHRVKNSGTDPSLDVIEKKVMESSQIIENLLYYSRLRKPSREEIDIDDIIVESIATARSRYPNRDVDMNFLSRVDHAICGDPTQLKEVFINVIINAIDAIPQEKKGKIDVKAESNEKSIMVEIKDNGIGVSPELKDRLFEPFFTTKSRGTGLGLAVCRQIIDAHRGKIYFESTVGQGSAVTILLLKTMPEAE